MNASAPPPLAIELNTFGGRVDAAVAIRDALMDTKLHTAVFVNRRAISAGALISFSCDSIAMARGGTIGAATPVTQAPGEGVAQPVAEKYVSYFRAEMRTTAETNGRDGDIAEAMVDAGKRSRRRQRSGQAPDLEHPHRPRARDGRRRGRRPRRRPRKARAAGPEGRGSPNVVRVPGRLPHKPGGRLPARPGDASSSRYLEYQTPGFGLFGSAAVFCFLILYFGHYMVNLAGWEEMILFALGLVLLIAEIFVTPGFGVLGFAGLASILTSFVMLLMAGDWSDLTFTNPFTADALMQVILTVLLAILAFFVMVRYLPRENPAFGGRIVLQTDLGTEEGYQSHQEAPESLVGETGKTITPLRPSGKALIAGKRRNVETEGGICRGRPGDRGAPAPRRTHRRSRRLKLARRNEMPEGLLTIIGLLTLGYVLLLLEIFVAGRNPGDRRCRLDPLRHLPRLRPFHHLGGRVADPLGGGDRRYRDRLHALARRPQARPRQRRGARSGTRPRTGSTTSSANGARP